MNLIWNDGWNDVDSKKLKLNIKTTLQGISGKGENFNKLCSYFDSTDNRI